MRMPWQPSARGLGQIRGLIGARAVHQVLQRLDVARGGVVDHDQGEAEAEPARGLELAERHVEAAVAGQRRNRPVGSAEPGADRPGHAVADRGEPAVRHEAAPWPLAIEQEPTPVGGETAVGDQDAVRGQRPIELGHEAGHVDRHLVGGQPRRDRAPPHRHPLADLGGVVGADRAQPERAIGHGREQILEARPGVAPERDRRRIAPTDLLRHDVEVDERLAGRWHGIAFGRDLAQLAADHEQAVGGLDQIVGAPRIAAENPGRKRVSAVSWARSSGTSTTTGPGRPVVAIMKARRTSSGIRSIRSTRSTSLTAGRRISSWRLSWVMFFQEWARWLSPTSGTGHAGVQALDQRGHEVGRIRPEGGIAHADPVGDAGIGIGRERAAALVVDQGMAQPEPASERYQPESAAVWPPRR
jgi:hypothetical protein